ncbi:lipocalin family protein [Winogradskyella luteola]|uniref:Lipocalin family protein n=1 Tax=Winogradskyella luteola TaxID=2828330 RepID=A0A9X1FB07_9FLAO|nr:DUF5004 domain-containing protein [Winogradskyella luteola]MBV7269315.1 lipocalin family protein [Winogradskyella luteola]
MKNNMLIVFILFNLVLNAQIINNESIKGKWEVVDMEKSPENPPFSLMTDSFRNASFTFNEDKTFKLETSHANSFFSMIVSVVNNSVWRLSGDANQVSVLIENNEEKELEIFITKSDENILFKINAKDDYFLMKMNKV